MNKLFFYLEEIDKYLSIWENEKGKNWDEMEKKMHVWFESYLFC